MTDLTGKRVLILGAETDIGRAVTTAVAEAGASVAAVAATSDAEAAFTVQRLARRLSSDDRKVIAQAIDATNEAAVRVMVRQVSKELGGLDAVALLAVWKDSGELAMGMALEGTSSRLAEWAVMFQHTVKFAEKEFQRTGDGKLVLLMRPPGFVETAKSSVVAIDIVEVLDLGDKPSQEIGADVVAAIAEAPS